MPIAIATWKFGKTAVEAAWDILAKGGPALNAAIAGARACEDDPSVNSVGYGGLGDRNGCVTLDASVMDGRTLSCGAVGGVENIRHVADLARCVMEKSPHIFLVGKGARDFALVNGFPSETLHTSGSVAEWEQRQPNEAIADELSHDTVTVLALDRAGNLGGACSTSGLFFKFPGRVGDSPIIGAGLYIDNESGAAGATGVGEEVVRICGSYYITELIRSGKGAREACELAVRRVIATAKRRRKPVPRVAFIALDPKGEPGSACTSGSSFVYAIARESGIEELEGNRVSD